MISFSRRIDTKTYYVLMAKILKSTIKQRKCFLKKRNFMYITVHKKVTLALFRIKFRQITYHEIDQKTPNSFSSTTCIYSH